MKHLLFLLPNLLVVLNLQLANGEEEATSKTRVGPGRAVLEAVEAKGIRLSDNALRNIELRFATVLTDGAITVPANELVAFQDFFAVYRRRDGWIKMIEVEPRTSNGTAQVSSKELKIGDEIVVKNAALLRVVDLDVWGPEADACVD